MRTKYTNIHDLLPTPVARDPNYATHLLGKNNLPVRKIRDINNGEALLSHGVEKIRENYRKYNPCPTGYAEVVDLQTGRTLQVRRDSLRVVR